MAGPPNLWNLKGNVYSQIKTGQLPFFYKEVYLTFCLFFFCLWFFLYFSLDVPFLFQRYTICPFFQQKFNPIFLLYSTSVIFATFWFFVCYFYGKKNKEKKKKKLFLLLTSRDFNWSLHDAFRQGGYYKVQLWINVEKLFEGCIFICPDSQNRCVVLKEVHQTDIRNKHTAWI